MFKILLTIFISLVISFNVHAEEYLPYDNSFMTYHTSPDYRASESHPLRILSYVVHPIGWLVRELVTRPFSSLMAATTETRSIFGYRHAGDYRTPTCFNSGNSYPDCRSIPPYNYDDNSKASEDYATYNVESAVDSVYFPVVNFAFNSSKLNARGKAKAEEIAKIITDNSGVEVVLEGHTDAVGSNDYNNALGLRRAESVKAELVKLGVSSESLSTVTFGETRLVTESSDKNAENRRVEAHAE